MCARNILIAAAFLAAASCSGSGSPAPEKLPPSPHKDPATPAPPDQNVDHAADFAKAAEAFHAKFLEYDPHEAVDMGFHEYDGTLPDFSPEALEARVAWLKESKETFAAFEGKLEGTPELERQVILYEIRGQLFDHDVAAAPTRNPMFYMWPAGLINYVSRDYAPAPERARAVIAACAAAPLYFEQARANLAEEIPKTWIQTALLMTRGGMQFAKDDVAPALKEGIDEQLADKLDAGLATYVEALKGYEAFLVERMKKATDDYPLGAETFRRMLLDVEGVDIELERLEEIGRADLERNLASLEQAAKKLAPKKSVAKAVDQVRANRPKIDRVIPLATEQSVEMKKFLEENDIVSIPTDDVAEVKPSPPFMRWNFAFMSSPGAFEKRKLPSFYYISPPDPSWPKKVQKEYISSRADLLFVTIHEVWPGHFLQGLHIRTNESKILKSFCSYSNTEGWAHYTEEMMWDAGVGDGSPEIHIGQLQNALLRNVRYLSAIGLHTQGMTVARSKKMFIDKGYQDEGSAQQQAVRGTFDPGYLNYTLGKLMIMKLREDWKKAQGDDYSLKAFHDAFLSHGCAPVPVIRRSMLGPDAGPAL